ncbi:MAG: AsmA family protein [bacterium]
MKKLLRILVLIIGIIIALIIIGYIAISSLLTAGYLRSVVEKMASEAINYPVEIGRVSLNFGFKIAIGIDHLSIPNPPEFSMDKMVSIENIRLNLKLLPLLKRQIVISGISVKGANVKIQKNINNQYNIMIPQMKKKGGKGWAIELDEINIYRSNVAYYDHTSKIDLQIKDIRQTIRFKHNLITVNGNQTLYLLKTKIIPELIVKINNNIEYDTISRNISVKVLRAIYDPLDLKISGVIEKSEMLNLKAEVRIFELTKAIELIPKENRPQQLSGSIKMDISVLGSTKEPKVNGKCELINIAVRPAGFNENIEKINGSFAFDLNSIKNIIIQGILGTSHFDISGAITNFKNPLLDLVIKIVCNLAEIKNLSDQTKELKLNGFANINLTVKGYLSNPKYFGDYSVTDATIDGIGLSLPITNFRTKGTIQNDGAKITVCSGHIGHSDFSFTGHITDFKKPVIQINNSSNLIDLDELLPRTKTTKKTEQKAIPVVIQGNMKINRLTGMDMEFRNINTSFVYENSTVDLKNCRAETFDGKVQFDFYYNSQSPEPYRIYSRMENISTQKILKKFLKFENLQGRLSGVNNFQGKGFTQKEVMTNLNASGNIKLVNGVFTNFEFFNKLFNWMGFEDRKVIPLGDLVCSYKIINGKANIEDWSMSTGIGNFLTNGTIRLDGAIDLNITLTLNKKESDLLKKYHGDWLLYFDSKGRATLDIIASGKLLSPQFKLDTHKIQQRLKGKVKDEYEKKKKEIENKFKNLLKK